MSFRCQACGYRSPKWLGRCPQCGEYGTFEEEKEASQVPPELAITEPPKPLPEVPAPPLERLSTGLPEVDRVLGGLVPGAVVLFGGEPGIGKSTLLLQLAANIADQYGKVLYVSGEEAPSQVKLRAQRLRRESPNLYLLSTQDLLQILNAVSRVTPVALVVDSLQTVLANPEGGEVGSISQVRESAAQL
ncbi:AAA family ATPase, partial [Candidatus Bipolaricaulota bacterium]|nr:AAA family ATPase [Candidatus Bipolaricaulota bacterium]